ncbi:unnamed protein product [Acanthoscelides obtectus]|uniref:Uncharacterized protein n=1 Tax=Acanthoscelides obtectus TaxID=200917 RepID=A0A9P0M4T8_ACAOB|nr:unnamed protein product [Acanthoscelides obtectus]CAK1670438.1 hypothetical protein AOBTE_LOCUS27639 [Acanthoscelides obtectus]
MGIYRWFTPPHLKEHKQSPPLPNDRAYKEPIPINEKKILDIKKVMCHTHGEILPLPYDIMENNKYGKR